MPVFRGLVTHGNSVDGFAGMLAQRGRKGLERCQHRYARTSGSLGGGWNEGEESR